jgi:hypothetical protein
VRRQQPPAFFGSFALCLLAFVTGIWLLQLDQSIATSLVLTGSIGMFVVIFMHREAQ